MFCHLFSGRTETSTKMGYEPTIRVRVLFECSSVFIVGHTCASVTVLEKCHRTLQYEVYCFSWDKTFHENYELYSKG